MKTKYSLIPFIPAAIVMIGLKIMSIFGVDSNGLLFGMNKSGINYFIIGITLGLFAVCVIINIFDRRTAPVYKVKKNLPAGILAVLSGIAMAAASFLTLLNTTPGNTDNYLMSIIVALFSIPAAVAMILMSKAHFTGKTTVSNASMFFVFPALWGCCGLVSEFLAATKVSISASDMTPLFCYIFITLYLFSSSMVVSRVKGRNPVKACFIYGMPAAAVSIAYGVGAAVTAFVESTGVYGIASGVMFVIIGLYIVAFSVEMFTGTLTKAEVEIIDSLPEEEDTYENSYISSGGYDELVVSDKDDDSEQSDAGENYEAASQGLSDFVMGYDESRYDEATIQPAKVSDDLVLSVDEDVQPELIKEDKKPAPEKAEEKKSPEPEIPEELKNAKRLNVSEEKPAAPKKKPAVEPQPEITADRMSEIDRLLKELEDKK